jgi:hypothetical protein
MKRKALEEAFTNIVPSEAVPLWQQDGELLNWLQSLADRIRRDVMLRKSMGKPRISGKSMPRFS